VELDRRRRGDHEPRGRRAGYSSRPRNADRSRGISSVGYHTNPITGWQVRADGTVVFRPEPWT
jgi:hypothetical protein